MKILFAEGEKDLNRVISNRLIENGHSVESCFDGEATIAHIAESNYDAIILDYTLPKKDGFEVLDTVRKSGVSTPILFMTSRGAEEICVRSLDYGANDCIKKPFFFNEMMQKLSAIMMDSYDRYRIHAEGREE